MGVRKIINHLESSQKRLKNILIIITTKEYKPKQNGCHLFNTG